MKRIAILAVALSALAFGVACGGGGSDAKGLYKSFVAEYKPVLEEVYGAFADESEGGFAVDSFEEFVADYDCEPFDSEAAAIVVALIGPSVTAHGGNPVEFMNDFRALDKAIRAEGYCNGTASTTAPAPTTTTTVPVPDNTSTTLECARLGAELSDTMGEWTSTVESSLSLFSYSPELKAQAIEVGTELASAFRLWDSTCGALIPDANGDEVADAIDDVLSSIRAL